MKLRWLAFFLAVTVACHAQRFVNNVFLGPGYNVGEPIIGESNITLTSPALYLATAWTIAGNLILEKPGSYTVYGPVALAGSIQGPATGTTTIRFVNSPFTMAGTSNVTTLQGPEVPTGPTLVWVQQPTPLTAEIGGSVQFSFTVRSAFSEGNLTVAVQRITVGGGPSRFTIVSQSISRVKDPVGDYVQGSFVVQMDNLVAGDQGTYTFFAGENGVPYSPASQGALLRVVAVRPPVITSQPVGLAAFTGGQTTFSVTATGSGTLTYQWQKNGTPIAGATARTLTLTNLQASDGGSYMVAVTNAGGTTVSSAATLTLTVAVAPTISAQPQSVTATEGDRVALSVTAAGVPALTYQWWKDGVVVSGATGATFILAAATLADSGQYSVAVSNAVGSTTSEAARVTINRLPEPGRIINLSILTSIAADETFTLGYVVGGKAGAKPLVIRAAGPSLGALGVAGAAADPKIELFARSTKTIENDDWGGGLALALAMNAVGAFPFAATASRDAASAVNVGAGDNSVRVSSVGAGAVIAEIYDGTPAGSWTPATPRLTNASVLKAMGAGITAGFVVGGEKPLRVLIRAVGPGLTALGVSGAVPDPVLSVQGGGAVIASNDDWNAADAPLFTSVGAFGLPAGSRDAALVLTLPPGNYTAQATGIPGATGLVLVEIYEMP